MINAMTDNNELDEAKAAVLAALDKMSSSSLSKSHQDIMADADATLAAVKRWSAIMGRETADLHRRIDEIKKSRSAQILDFRQFFLAKKGGREGWRLGDPEPQDATLERYRPGREPIADPSDKVGDTMLAHRFQDHE